MLYMGAFMLLVLPLFLFVCIRMIAQSSWRHKFGAYVLESVFYVMIAFCVFGLFAFVAAIARS